MLKKLFFIPLVFLVVGCHQGLKSTRSQIYNYLEDKDLDSIMSVLQTESSVKNLKRYHDSQGNNILHLVVEKNDLNAFRTLSSNHNYTLPYNRYNNKYETPLGLAISLGECQMAELLLIKGADPLFITNNHPTYLVQSLLQKKYSCAETLLIQSKKAINQLGTHEWQALHYAAYMGDTKAIQILLPYQPHLDDKVSVEEGVPYYNQDMLIGIGKLNPFQLAVVKGNLKVAQLLLKTHKDYAKKVTSNGTTNMELAQISQSVAMIAWITSIDPETKPRTKPKIEPADSGNVFDKDMQNISKSK